MSKQSTAAKAVFICIWITFNLILILQVHIQNQICKIKC